MLKVFKFLSDGYPEYKMVHFRADWQKLTDEDKEQLKTGIENGTFDY